MTKRRSRVMGRALLPAVGVFAAAVLAGCAAGYSGTLRTFPNPPHPAEITASMARSASLQTAVLAGGCFWGVQGVFERLRGVENTVAGYSGGSAATANYEMVSTGTTGHAESVEITFDPRVVSFGMLLKVFFSVVENPTELDYQGPDHGTQYRSVVFYRSGEQKAIVADYIAKLTASKVFSRPIVTQVVPFKAFYPAESYHQHFMDKHPDSPYILMWDRPKVELLDKFYPNLVASARMK